MLLMDNLLQKGQEYTMEYSLFNKGFQEKDQSPRIMEITKVNSCDLINLCTAKETISKRQTTKWKILVNDATDEINFQVIQLMQLNILKKNT